MIPYRTWLVGHFVEDHPLVVNAIVVREGSLPQMSYYHWNLHMQKWPLKEKVFHSHGGYQSPEIRTIFRQHRGGLKMEP